MTGYFPLNKSIIFVQQMNKVVRIILLVCAVGLIGCHGSAEGGSIIEDNVDNAAGISESTSGADILFDTLVNDLGDVREGEQVLSYFRYKNIGGQPLVIHSIKAGCGCTAPQWSEKPLQAGERDAIKVLFNSSGKRGSQNIRITVTSNSGNPVSSLVLKAVVN